MKMSLKTFYKLISGQNQWDRSRLVLVTYSGSAPDPALWTVIVAGQFLKVHGKKLLKQSKAPEQEADRIHLKTLGCALDHRFPPKNTVWLPASWPPQPQATYYFQDSKLLGMSDKYWLEVLRQELEHLTETDERTIKTLCC